MSQRSVYEATVSKPLTAAVILEIWQRMYMRNFNWGETCSWVLETPIRSIVLLRWRLSTSCTTHRWEHSICLVSQIPHIGPIKNRQALHKKWSRCNLKHRSQLRRSPRIIETSNASVLVGVMNSQNVCRISSKVCRIQTELCRLCKTWWNSPIA